MDGSRFDHFARALIAAPTRRSVLVAAAALLAGGAAEEAAAACRATGTRCTAAGQCCSGRCVKKRGTTKRFCRRAPGQGTCTIERNTCADAGLGCGASADGSSPCTCYVTVGGAAFCGENVDQFLDCSGACTAETDCSAATGIPGSRCVGAAGSRCCGTGATCIPPCPNPSPAT